ncbi:MAG: nucleoside triphosphate pyrophosphohydrolase [Chitinivibrionales bacterium]|nr:nucleoside triphosphate pyrophosphohydrolase [Chitinivibrionales bacterium]
MSQEIDRFIEIIARLRGPGGCPWDREQTHKSILNCLLDETYEFFEAAERDNDEKMKEELGDLLLQVVLHAQIASEREAFTIDDVARGINEKIIRRHPHVFGNTKVSSTGEVLNNWEEIKRKEKGMEDRKYIVDGVPEALPALFRAEKVQRRVARVGFDWADLKPVLDKVEEEFGEFRESLEKGDQDNAMEELGDILFALVNVARHNKICAEDALRMTVKKFIKRFRYIEDKYTGLGKDIRQAPLEEMDCFWEESKKAVKSTPE